jgi:hypothetical protein
VVTECVRNAIYKTINGVGTVQTATGHDIDTQKWAWSFEKVRITGLKEQLSIFLHIFR